MPHTFKIKTVIHFQANVRKNCLFKNAQYELRHRELAIFITANSWKALAYFPSSVMRLGSYIWWNVRHSRASGGVKLKLDNIIIFIRKSNAPYMLNTALSFTLIKKKLKDSKSRSTICQIFCIRGWRNIVLLST